MTASPLPAALEPVTIETAAHVVQLALTPVFLLSGVATLLNVFATRLGRVADQTDLLSRDGPDGPERQEQLRTLRLRTIALDAAVVLAALAGAATCASVLVLFLGGVLGGQGAGALFFVFGGAVVFTMGALVAFVLEMLLAARATRRLVDALRRPFARHR